MEKVSESASLCSCSYFLCPWEIILWPISALQGFNVIVRGVQSRSLRPSVLQVFPPEYLNQISRSTCLGSTWQVREPFNGDGAGKHLEPGDLWSERTEHGQLCFWVLAWLTLNNWGIVEKKKTCGANPFKRRTKPDSAVAHNGKASLMAWKHYQWHHDAVWQHNDCHEVGELILSKCMIL